MKPHSFFRWWWLGVSLAFPASLFAGVPALLNCQGRVSIGGTNYDGTGVFQFALVDGTGARSFWSNGASSVSLSVNRGLYSILLGDTNVANMAALPAAVFTNGDVRLRVSFAPQGQTPQWLSPDQRIASVGYAFAAGDLDNGIWSAHLGSVVDDQGQTHSNLLLFSSGGDWRMAFVPNGEIHVRGDLSTEGNVYADGAIQSSGAFETSGDISIASDGNLHVRLGTDGAIGASGDLNLGGRAEIAGDLRVQGEVTLQSNVWVDGQVNLNTNLNVDGNASIDGTLAIGESLIVGQSANVNNLYVQSLEIAGRPVPVTELDTRIVFGSIYGGTPNWPATGFSVTTNATVGSGGTAYWGDGILLAGKTNIQCGASDGAPDGFSTPRCIFYGGKYRIVKGYWYAGGLPGAGATVLVLGCPAWDLDVGYHGSIQLDPSLVNSYTVTFDTPFSDLPTVIVSSGGDSPGPIPFLHGDVRLGGMDNPIHSNGFRVVHAVYNTESSRDCEPVYPQSDPSWHFIAIGRFLKPTGP